MTRPELFDDETAAGVAVRLDSTAPALLTLAAPAVPFADWPVIVRDSSAGRAMFGWACEVVVSEVEDEFGVWLAA